MAVENARLYDQLENSRQEVEEALDKERHFSLLLQTALLPSEPFVGDGYSLAVGYVPVFISRQVGGDFYDAFRGGNGWGVAVIGDVSGKGLEAASLAAATRSTLHAFAHEVASPARVLARSNKVLYAQQLAAESFVTVFLAAIDLDAGTIRYCSAGHPPAVILRAGGTVDFLVSSDLPLVIMEQQDYTQSEDRLLPGDKLVLYTDGISEARADTVMFDLEGIERTLAGHGDWTPQEVVNNLISAATEWADGKLRDDAAVVVVQRY